MTFIASERNAPVPPSAPIKLLAEPVMLGRPVSSTIPAVNGREVCGCWSTEYYWHISQQRFERW